MMEAKVQWWGNSLAVRTGGVRLAGAVPDEVVAAARERLLPLLGR